eukprot:m.7969 g.7969  ORF g.7969 m.7969 type:complete len:409 (+) comp6851_c0_seq1:73-1299(+)
MVLSDRQREELNKAVLAYLQSQGFDKAVAGLRDDAGLSGDVEPKFQNLLEKKWTSVIRLQKKVMDLESKLGDATEELTAPRKIGGAKDSKAWIPRPPARHTMTGHRMSVTAVVFHPVYSILISASEDATIKMWDFESGEFERTLKGHTNVVNDLAVDDRGTTIASCSSDLTIKLWAFESFENTKTLRGHDHIVSSVDFTPSADFVVSASRDKTIKVWETSTGFCVRTLTGHSDWVRKVRLHAGGELLASVSSDQSVRIWNFKTSDCKHAMREHTHVVDCLAWAPASATSHITAMMDEKKAKAALVGPFLATGGRDKVVKIFDAGTGTCLQSFAGHDDWITGLVFHPGGKFLLSCADDKTIRIWDLANKRCSKTLEAHSHFVSCLDMHKTSPYVATGSVDLSLRIWECR